MQTYTKVFQIHINIDVSTTLCEQLPARYINFTILSPIIFTDKNNPFVFSH